MPILDRRSNQFIEDKDTRVSVGIDFPFARVPNQDGYFSTTKTTIESVKNNIRLLLQTQKGERIFQPNLGINLRRLLFEQVTDENLLSIQDAILDKFDFWLPFVEIRDIQVLNTDNDTTIGVNEIRVKILFNIKQDPNTLDSITLSFDTGNISESESTITSGGGY